MSDTIKRLHKEHIDRMARIAAAAVPDTAPQRIIKRDIGYITASYIKNKNKMPVAPVIAPVVVADPLPMELPELLPPSPSPSILFVSYVQRYIAAHYGFSHETLVGRSHAYGVTHARHVAMYIVETLTRRSRADIGLRFNRDHSTVFHATNKIKKQLEHDAKLCEEVGTLMTRIVEGRRNKVAAS